MRAELDVERRGADLEHEVARPHGPGVRGDLRSGLPVVLVREVRSGSGAGLDEEVHAELLEVGDRLGGQGHPLLVLDDLLRDPDLHVLPS